MFELMLALHQLPLLDKKRSPVLSSYEGIQNLQKKKRGGGINFFYIVLGEKEDGKAPKHISD